MTHLPTICDGCGRVTLSLFAGSVAGTPGCAHCGGPRRVVPSCSYTDADVPLFEELSEAVSDGLGPFEAQRLGLELNRALWSGTTAEIFDALAARWTSLMPLVLVTGRNEAHQRRVLLMLKTIFDALSSARRSAAVATVAAETRLAERRND